MTLFSICWARLDIFSVRQSTSSTRRVRCSPRRDSINLHRSRRLQLGDMQLSCFKGSGNVHRRVQARQTISFFEQLLLYLHMHRPNNQLLRKTSVRFKLVGKFALCREDSTTSNELVDRLLHCLATLVKVETRQVRIDLRLNVFLEPVEYCIQLVSLIGVCPCPAIVNITSVTTDP